jgi:hypothetical protein
MRIEHKLMTRTTCEILHKSKQWVAGGLALAFLVALGACLPARPNPETATGTAPAGGGEGAAAMGFEVRSEVFVAGEPIPGKFTCDGSDVSPPLSWTGLPQGVASLALIMEDPDAAAGIWVHWLLYNIPASLDGLPEGVPADSELPDGSRSGLNSWGRSGYGALVRHAGPTATFSGSTPWTPPWISRRGQPRKLFRARCKATSWARPRLWAPTPGHSSRGERKAGALASQSAGQSSGS